MIELVQSVKRAAMEAVESQVPAAPCIGSVIEDSPLVVQLNQRLALPGRRLLFMEGQKEPRKGDNLALLRFVGGQKYLVLGWLEE